MALMDWTQVSWTLCEHSIHLANEPVNRIVYMYKMDFALNNLQVLICHKTEQSKPHEDR